MKSYLDEDRELHLPVHIKTNIKNVGGDCAGFVKHQQYVLQILWQPNPKELARFPKQDMVSLLLSRS